MNLTSAQYEALLEGLNPAYVSTRQGGGRSLSYVEAWHIKRTLTRIFGFGGWSADVLEAEHMFTESAVGTGGRENFHVGYKVIMRLTVSDGVGDIASYTEAAVGFATLPSLGEAHDMAVKTAESDALKRCAINFGDQFGLSLYNGGTVDPVVQRTLNPPIDYVPRGGQRTSEGAPLPTPPADSEEAASWVERMVPLVKANDAAGIVELRREANAANANDLMHQGCTVATWFDRAVQQIGRGGADA